MRRLSYADRLLPPALILAGLVVALTCGAWIYHDARFYSSALGDQYVSDEIYYVDVARRLLINVFHVQGVHWYNWSGKTNPDYYNPEHPPLGKYIIGLSMLLCGDRPVCWRMPGVLEASLVPVVLYLGYALRRRSAWSAIAGLAAALAAASAVSLRYEAAVAMLDIHQAFFESLAIAALALESPLAASILVGLAASVKYSGLFMVPALWVYPLAKGSPRRERVKVFIESILAPVLVLLALNAPIIAHFGFKWFWENSVVGALSWHTESRPPGPPVSSPGGWLVNANPFYFDYNTMIGGVANTLLQVSALLIGGIALVYAFAYNSWPAAGAASLYSILALYLLLSHLYILHIPHLKGNQTLYSFYLVQLTPASAAVMGDLVALMGGDS